MLGWWRRLQTMLRGDNLSAEQARARFAEHRADLERAFFEAASNSGKPRGLRWQALEWEPGVELAREKETGKLAALVGVNISFEAVEGGDMEDVSAVGLLRNASAVFFLHRGVWHTTGKVIMNLNPDEAIQHFGGQYERVA
jgi:hypothetical protein